MRVYKRVQCTHCKKTKDLSIDEDKVKQDACVSCGQTFNITIRNADYYVDYGYQGRRIRENVGKSKSVAETILAKIKTEIAENRYLDVKKEKKIKFEDFADEYFNVHSKQHKKSWKTDSYIINRLKDVFRGRFLQDITAKDIEDYRIVRLKEKVNGKPISPATINRHLDVLSNIFNKAIEWNKLQNNPMKAVKSLKVALGRLRFLEKEETAKLIANCSGYIKPIVVIALNTGMRKGEILGLKWEDIDYKRNLITLLNTKNGEKREVPMNGNVQNVLRSVKKHPESDYLFCNKNGVQMYDIRKSFSTALRKSGINSFRFHDLRHTFASHLTMSGIEIFTVKELLGHKDIAMTMRYSHLSPNHKSRAVDVLVMKKDTQLTQEKVVEISENSHLLQVIAK